MKIYFMGTGAYERIPSMFCKCGVCEQARRLGGKNIRTHAQVLIDDTLLVDFGQDSYLHALKSNADFTKIQNLIITHAHSDHFMPNELFMTTDPFGYNDIKSPIQVFGNAECKKIFNTFNVPAKCIFYQVSPYECFRAGKYSITAIPAHHGTEMPLCYMIDDGEKVFLYNNGSGIFTDEVYAFIERSGYQFDAVIADCSTALLNETGGTHMSFSDNEIHREKLNQIGALKEHTLWIVTHYSHSALFEDHQPVTAERLEEIAREKKMLSAFDGMEITI